MTLKQVLPFLILMQNNDGLIGKSSSYVLEKLKASDGYDQSFRLLDAGNSRKLLEWLQAWHQESIYSENELEEIKRQIGTMAYV